MNNEFIRHMVDNAKRLATNSEPNIGPWVIKHAGKIVERCADQSAALQRLTQLQPHSIWEATRKDGWEVVDEGNTGIDGKKPEGNAGIDGKKPASHTESTVRGVLTLLKSIKEGKATKADIKTQIEKLLKDGKVPLDKDPEDTKVKKLTEKDDELGTEDHKKDGIDCDICGDFVPEDEIWVDASDNTVCHKCYKKDPAKDEKLTEGEDGIDCDICGDFVPEDEIWVDAIGNTVCHKCYKKNPAKEEKSNNESKLTEDDKEFEPDSQPEIDQVKDPANPTPAEGEEEEQDTVTKEYVGKTEDTHFYMVSTPGQTDEAPADMQIVDQEGTQKYSAKEQNLDPADPANFIIQAIQELEIDEITRSVLVKYILPMLEEDETEEEEKPEGMEDETGAEDEEAGDKNVEPTKFEKDNEAKVNEAEVTDVESGDIGYRFLIEDYEVSVVDTLDRGKDADVNCKRIIDAIHSHTDELNSIELNPVDESKKVNENDPATKQEGEDYFRGELIKYLEKMGDRLTPEEKDLLVKAKKERTGPVPNEAKVPDDKDPEATKIKKLIETFVQMGDDRFEVEHIDDGTPDTVIAINGQEYRFDQDFASMWRDEATGELSKDGLTELALDALSNMEEEEYDEVKAAGDERSDDQIEEEEAARVRDVKLDMRDDDLEDQRRERGRAEESKANEKKRLPDALKNHMFKKGGKDKKKDEECKEGVDEKARCTKREKRQVKHIEKGEKTAGQSAKKAKEIAYATVNKLKTEGKVNEDKTKGPKGMRGTDLLKDLLGLG